MNIDVYTATGTKKGTLSLPPALFEAPINVGLMHQAVQRQRSNRRHPIAHAKSRGEVAGSTAKLYAQKHTGRARRGSVRSPLLRGGGKAFGPKSIANFQKDMPHSMRRSALFSCLSYQAKHGAIIGLESYPETIKTKDMAALLKKLPVESGRRLLFVLPASHEALGLSIRNIKGAKMLLASYLNPVDILGAKYLIFLAGAIEKAEEVFGAKKNRVSKKVEEALMKEEAAATKEKSPMKPKSPTKKKSSVSSKKKSSPSLKS